MLAGYWYHVHIGAVFVRWRTPRDPHPSAWLKKGEDRRKKKREVLHLFRCYMHTHTHTHTHTRTHAHTHTRTHAHTHTRTPAHPHTRTHAHTHTRTHAHTHTRTHAHTHTRTHRNADILPHNFSHCVIQSCASFLASTSLPACFPACAARPLYQGLLDPSAMPDRMRKNNMFDRMPDVKCQFYSMSDTVECQMECQMQCLNIYA